LLHRAPPSPLFPYTTLFRSRVLVYSRRYHRPNPQVEDNQTYSPKLHCEDLAAMLLTLDLAPAQVIGSSYGAYTALQLVRDHPQRSEEHTSELQSRFDLVCRL